MTQVPPPASPIDEERVFQEPWEARAFAIVVSLHERGLYTWGEWADGTGRPDRRGRGGRRRCRRLVLSLLDGRVGGPAGDQRNRRGGRDRALARCVATCRQSNPAWKANRVPAQRLRHAAGLSVAWTAESLHALGDHQSPCQVWIDRPTVKLGAQLSRSSRCREELLWWKQIAYSAEPDISRPLVLCLGGLVLGGSGERGDHPGGTSWRTRRILPRASPGTVRA
jgi:Nitrile hydratase beta subunit, N-terminal